MPTLPNGEREIGQLSFSMLASSITKLPYSFQAFFPRKSMMTYKLYKRKMTTIVLTRYHAEPGLECGRMHPQG